MWGEAPTKRPFVETLRAGRTNTPPLRVVKREFHSVASLQNCLSSIVGKVMLMFFASVVLYSIPSLTYTLIMTRGWSDRPVIVLSPDA